MIKQITSLVLLMIYFSINAQSLDSLKPNKKPIKTYYFKSNLSFKNACLKSIYAFNKQTVKISKALVNTNEWELVFFDEFDSLDTKKWRLGQAWGEFHPDHLHQYYSKQDIKVSNGTLKLFGSYNPKSFKLKDSNVIIPYSVGLINSDISFKQKYGYFEIRSKNPKGPATLPAFWLAGANRWPPEIDIFEMYGKKTGKTVHNQYATIHWGKSGTKSRGYLTKKINLPNNTDTFFHVYACEWSPKFIKFYTDGKLVNSIRVNKRLRKWLDDEMVVIINNCFEAQYVKYLTPDFKSNFFEIDYVRVYQRKKIKN